MRRLGSTAGVIRSSGSGRIPWARRLPSPTHPLAAFTEETAASSEQVTAASQELSAAATELDHLVSRSTV